MSFRLPRRSFSATRSASLTSRVETETILGECLTIWSAMSEAFAPAARPTTSKRPGNDSTTFRHCRPIEPVEPRMDIRFMAGIDFIVFAENCESAESRKLTLLRA